MKKEGIVDEAQQRQLILDTLEKFDHIDKLRAEQGETIAQMRRALAHKYFWPEGYAGGTTPKILFVGAYDRVTMTMTRLDTLEMRSFTFRVKPVTNKSRANCTIKNQIIPWGRVELVDPPKLDIPEAFVLAVVKPYIDNCF